LLFPPTAHPQKKKGADTADAQKGAIVFRKISYKKLNAGRLQRLRSGVWLDGSRLKEATVELVSRQQGDGGGAIFFF
jgi:hypothetical protein